MGWMRIAGFVFVLVLVAAACDLNAKMPNKCQADEQCREGAYCDVGRALCVLACEKVGCLEGHFCDLDTHVCNPWVPLEALTISAGTLVPAFTTEVTSYNAEVAYANASLTVTPTAGDAGSIVTVNGVTVKSGEASQAIALVEGRNEIELIVTAVSGITKKTYVLSVYRRDGPGAGKWEAIPLSPDLLPVTFTMGSPVEELGRNTSVETQHEVTLTHRFEILSTEVTQKEFQNLMGYNPSYFKPDTYPSCPTCPVEQATWHEAAAYCNALSGEKGYDKCYKSEDGGVTYGLNATYATPYECPGYRLPTEAEWEYAARAGDLRATYNGDLDVTDGSFSAVLDPIAWFSGNIGNTMHAVAGKTPNDWGLYDMLGNVFEWCHDNWNATGCPVGAATDPVGTAGSYRVIRGGSWGSQAMGVRAALRAASLPADRSSGLGFRPVRSLP